MALRRQLAAQDTYLKSVLELVPDNATDEQVLFFVWAQEPAIADRVSVPAYLNSKCVKLLRHWIADDVADKRDFNAMVKLRPFAYKPNHFQDLFKFAVNRGEIFKQDSIDKILDLIDIQTPNILCYLLDELKSYPVYQQYALAVAYFLHIGDSFSNKAVFLNFICDGPTPPAANESIRVRWDTWGKTSPSNIQVPAAPTSLPRSNNRYERRRLPPRSTLSRRTEPRSQTNKTPVSIPPPSLPESPKPVEPIRRGRQDVRVKSITQATTKIQQAPVHVPPTPAPNNTVRSGFSISSKRRAMMTRREPEPEPEPEPKPQQKVLEPEPAQTPISSLPPIVEEMRAAFDSKLPSSKITRVPSTTSLSSLDDEDDTITAPTSDSKSAPKNIRRIHIRQRIREMQSRLESEIKRMDSERNRNTQLVHLQKRVEHEVTTRLGSIQKQLYNMQKSKVEEEQVQDYMDEELLGNMEVLEKRLLELELRRQEEESNNVFQETIKRLEERLEESVREREVLLKKKESKPEPQPAKKATARPPENVPTNQVPVKTKSRYSSRYTRPIVKDNPVAALEPVIDEPVVSAPVIDEPVVTAPVIDEPVVAAPVIDEPVVTAPVKVAKTPTSLAELAKTLKKNGNVPKVQHVEKTVSGQCTFVSLKLVLDQSFNTFDAETFKKSIIQLPHVVPKHTRISDAKSIQL